MTKNKKLEQRCWDIGREFFVLWGKKSSVPKGCVFAGIRGVAALAGMHNYQISAASCGLPRERRNAMDKYYDNSA